MGRKQDQSVNARTPLWLPWYWPAWLGVGLLWLSSRLPHGARLAIGQRLGALVRLLAGQRQRVVARNLELCLPHTPAAERAQLLRDHFESLGIGLLEMAMAWWTPDHRYPPVEVCGMEHLDAAREKGKGVILLSPHFTTLEISGRILRQHMRGTPRPMYRPLDNPVFEQVVASNRRRLFGELIAHDSIRALVRLLRRGEVVWYAPDQSYRRKQSAMVNFFGIPAPTNIGTSRLAAMTGAPVVPFFVQRLPGHQGYRLHLWPALEDFPGDDPVADSAHVNKVFEQQIAHCPEQYWWVHQRFKKRPAQYPDLYADIN